MNEWHKGVQILETIVERRLDRKPILQISAIETLPPGQSLKKVEHHLVKIDVLEIRQSVFRSLLLKSEAAKELQMRFPR